MSHNKCILFWSDKNDKSDILDGKYFSKLIDPIILMVKKMGHNYWELIRGVGDSNKEEYFHSNLIFFDNLKNKRPLLDPQRTVGFLKKRLGLMETYFNLDLEKKFESLLKEKKITSVIGIELPIELISACKKMDIQDFEIAHGYGYSCEKPPSCLRNRLKKTYPSNLVVFDKIAYENLASSFSEVKMYFCKHPFLNEIEHWKNKLSPKQKEFLTRINNSKKRTILCSLNWGYAKDHPEMRQLDGILNNGLIHEDLLKVIHETKSEINWLIRLHPIHVKNKDRYNDHFKLLYKLSDANNNIEWELSSEIPVIILLNYVSCHITMRSETAYDAALCGINTYFLCPLIKLEKYYSQLVNLGYANYCELIFGKIVQSLNSPLKFSDSDFFSKETIVRII